MTPREERLHEAHTLWRLFTTQAPIVLAAAILLGFLARSLLPRAFSTSGSPKQMLFAALPWLLMLFFVIFPMVSSSAFRAFSCEDFGNGKSFLRADYAIECNTEAYARVEQLAWLGILLYPVGISVLCEWQPFELASNKRSIHLRILAPYSPSVCSVRRCAPPCVSSRHPGRASHRPEQGAWIPRARLRARLQIDRCMDRG